MKNRYSLWIKNQAEELRRKGFSYKRIYSSLKIPKSTLSTWLGEKYPGVFDKKAQLEHLAKIRLLAEKTHRNNRVARLKGTANRVSEQIQKFSLTDRRLLSSMLAMLYWAEGAKYDRSPVNFANTDPKLAKLFITLLRKCYPINENKFRIRLHLHHYHPITKTRRFWSELLGVPLGQFGKIYIKKRSETKRFRKNFMGICFIRYYDNALQAEIMELAYQLAAKVV